jgi:hypothetical protein
MEVDSFNGFKIKRVEDKRFLDLTEKTIELSKVTRLSIPKKFIYIEEINGSGYFRLTFTSSLIEDIKKVNEIKII